MRKKHFSINIFFITILFAFKAFSQVSLYSFSQFTSPYTAISGGTLFGNTATDDQVFVNSSVPLGQGLGTSGPGLPIGFSFSFNGNVYDRLGINANGFIYLGSTVTIPYCETLLSNAYVPISATSTVQPFFQNKIVALGLDLQAQAVGGTSELRVQTLGTSPNRTTVVQWSAYRKFASVGDNFNFQIRLNETSNIVSVHYGSFVNNATAGLAQVGLRGLSGLDYNNRFSNVLTPWNSSVPGSLISSMSSLNNINLPQNGLVYRWTPLPPCSNAISSATILANPPAVCPGGSATLNLTNTFTNSGLSYVWQSSSSQNGNYSPLSIGACGIFTLSNIQSSNWYICTISCPGSGQSILTPPKQIVTSGLQPANVPYLEDFENILIDNQLPNCSWTVSSPSVVCLTYTSSNIHNRIANSGNNFAAFRSSTQVNGDYFYTNAIKLYSGVNYSASVSHVEDGSLGWSFFGMYYGLAQSPASLTAIASQTSNLLSIAYKTLSNTFTVPTTGVYYVAIKAIANNIPWYLCFDDISITAPCTINPVNVSINSSDSLICQGDQVTINATGANTYSWSNSIISNSIIVAPSQTNTFSAIGINTLTGCTSSSSLVINVNPIPNVAIFAFPASVCSGSYATLVGFGANSYTWSSGGASNSVIINPNANSSYSVIGTDINGCSAQATMAINVIPNPVISASVFPSEICAGESATVSAFGAQTYTWIGTNNLYNQIQNYVISPMISTAFTLVGANSNLCESVVYTSLIVNSCTGITALDSNDLNYVIYPNPFNEELTVHTNNQLKYTVEIYESLNKIIFKQDDLIGNTSLKLNISKGFYFLKITSKNKTQVFKCIKN